MKICSKILLVTSLGLALNAHATITCEKVKLSRPVNTHGSVYHFKASATCKLVGEKVDVPAIKDAYKAEIYEKKSQFKVHKESAYDDKKGLTGYKIDNTQSYDTPHGGLDVRSDILLLDDNISKFFLELRSKSIEGRDDSTYNKSILNQVTLIHTKDSDQVTVVKEIDVEQPWYAPQSTFFNTVEPELVESTKKSALLQARKIAGEKVEALRK